MDMPELRYIPVGVRRSKGSYEYPRVTIPVELIRRAGIKPGDILVAAEAGGVIILAKEEAAGDALSLIRGLLEALGYEPRVSDGNLLACKGGECILVAPMPDPCQPRQVSS